MPLSRHSQPIRVGIAGLGRSGWGIHAATLCDMQAMYRIDAVHDPSSERCREAHTRFGARMHARMEDLLADDALDLIVVATPTQLHVAHARAALLAGRHVVCEKPLALSTAQVDELIALRDRTGKVLAPFQNLRFSPDFLKIQQVIASGVLGRIVQIRMCRHGFGRRWDWQTLREFGGGELNNTGSHAIDQALVLFGEREPEIFYHCDRTLTLGDTEDHFKLVLRAPGQPLLEIDISRSCAWEQEPWLIMGTRGGLRGSMQQLHWKYTDFDHLPAREVERVAVADRSYNSEPLAWTEHHWTRSDDAAVVAPETAFYRALYATVRDGQPFEVTPESVRRQLAVIERCRAIASSLQLLNLPDPVTVG